MKTTWSVIEKLFASFPFRFLISAGLAGIVYAITPADNSLLLKFSVPWYIIFVGLIVFLILSFIIWLYTFIKNIYLKKRNKLLQSQQDIEEMNNLLEERRRQLYEITNKWSDDDIKFLRKFIKTKNKPIKKLGFVAQFSDTLLNSYYVDSKQEYELVKCDPDKPVRIEDTYTNVYTIYWLKEDFYELVKLIYERYEKLSKFDKGDKK